jgi:hypothetical protein
MSTLFLIMFTLQMGIFALLVYLIFKNRSYEEENEFQSHQESSNNVEFIFPL